MKRLAYFTRLSSRQEGLCLGEGFRRQRVGGRGGRRFPWLRAAPLASPLPLLARPVVGFSSDVRWREAVAARGAEGRGDPPVGGLWCSELHERPSSRPPNGRSRPTAAGSLSAPQRLPAPAPPLLSSPLPRGRLRRLSVSGNFQPGSSAGREAGAGGGGGYAGGGPPRRPVPLGCPRPSSAGPR